MRTPPSKTLKDQFFKTFQKSLFDFWHPIFGFNAVKFDDWLCVPDGTSTNDFVTKKFGPMTKKLINELIDC